MPEWFIAPVYGDGHEGVFNEHGFGEEAGWQAEAEEHSEGGEQQPVANFDLVKVRKDRSRLLSI